MDFLWVFVAIVIVASIFLNVIGTNIVRSSHIHDENKKRVLLLILWCLPIVGVFVVMLRINKDIKASEKKMEDEMAPAIREVADRLSAMDVKIQARKDQEKDKTKYH